MLNIFKKQHNNLLSGDFLRKQLLILKNQNVI